MTIALAIKVNDGIVLASDSATTMSQRTQNGEEYIINIYDNQNKVFNLHKGLPVGMITWGLGNIGSSSLTTLVKDFRKNITHIAEHKIDTDRYTVEELANKFYEFIYSERYVPAGHTQGMGFVIGGYSSESSHPEEWLIDIDNHGQCEGPILLREADPSDFGSNWFGQPEAIARLILGHSGALELILQEANINSEKIKEVMQLCAQHLQAQMFVPSMPIQDAIDIAQFLIETTIKYVKYTPGYKTVGGPIEIAVITKHEGFKWVSRKLYFGEKYNPKEG